MIHKILFSWLIVGCAVMGNLALFGVIGIEVMLGYLISGLCFLILLGLWN